MLAPSSVASEHFGPLCSLAACNPSTCEPNTGPPRKPNPSGRVPGAPDVLSVSASAFAPLHCRITRRCAPIRIGTSPPSPLMTATAANRPRTFRPAQLPAQRGDEAAARGRQGCRPGPGSHAGAPQRRPSTAAPRDDRALNDISSPGGSASRGLDPHTTFRLRPVAAATFTGGIGLRPPFHKR